MNGTHPNRQLYKLRTKIPSHTNVSYLDSVFVHSWVEFILPYVCDAWLTAGRTRRCGLKGCSSVRARSRSKALTRGPVPLLGKVFPLGNQGGKDEARGGTGRCRRRQNPWL